MNLLFSILISLSANASEISLKPGETIQVGKSQISCAMESREYVCGVERFSCCEFAPYIVNLYTGERKWIGSKTIHEENANKVVNQYIRAGKCVR